MDLLERMTKMKNEKETKEEGKKLAQSAKKITPRKKKQPKIIKRPSETFLIKEERPSTSHTSYIYSSNDPEIIKYKEKIEKFEQQFEQIRLNQEQNHNRDQKHFKIRRKMKLILEEMIREKSGEPEIIENKYVIETGCRPYYRGRPTYAFEEWLILEKRKTHKQDNLFINKDIEKPEEAIEEKKEILEEELEKNEASNQNIPIINQEIIILKDQINMIGKYIRLQEITESKPEPVDQEISFIKMEIKQIKRLIKTTNTTDPIERIKQNRPEQITSGNRSNFGSVMKEMKSIFSNENFKGVKSILTNSNERTTIDAHIYI